MHTQAIITKPNICPFTILILCSFQSVAAQLFVQIRVIQTCMCGLFFVLFYFPLVKLFEYIFRPFNPPSLPPITYNQLVSELVS